MIAASKGKTSFVRLLLEHGADINAEDSVRISRQISLCLVFCASFVFVTKVVNARMAGQHFILLPKRGMMRLLQICWIMELPLIKLKWEGGQH